MDRDEIILSCQAIVDNLVKKYNNHQSDEDLQSIGMIAVVECVDKCLSENMTDVSQIQARCNVWAKNRILDDIYKAKLKYSDDEFALDLVEADEPLDLIIFNTRQQLTPRQLEIFDMLMEGKSQEYIMAKLKIEPPTYYTHIQNIKKIIKS